MLGKGYVAGCNSALQEVSVANEHGMTVTLGALVN